MKKLLSLSAVLAATFVAAAWPGSARADDAPPSPDNAAVAINTKNGSSLFKFAFALRRVAGDVVANENAAVAYASCESCRTTAIAIQIVLVVGKPSTVTPANYSIAINENCTLCQTFSAAFQFVIGVEDATVGFTEQGLRELNRILREFKRLKKEEYTVAEFNARTKALGDRLRTLLATELKPGQVEPGDDEPGDDSEEEERPAPPGAPPASTTSSGQTTTGAATTGATTTAPDTGGAATTTAPTTTEAPPPPPPATTDTTTTPPPPTTTTP